MNSSPSVIAVFDFDHTLTNRDSFLPFLLRTVGFWRSVYYFLSLIFDFLKFLLGRISRQTMKEKIIRRFIGGWSFSQIEELGKHYASQQLDEYIKSAAWKRIAWHQSQGHRCLLVSAALEFYLKPWAKRHGFEEVLGSQLELTESGKITGRLLGKNCWGLEKKHRLLAYLNSESRYQLYVYGDSRGDHDILALADYPFYRLF